MRALLLCLVLVACNEETVVDQFGNRYPPPCRGDLSHVKAKVIDLSRAEMAVVGNFTNMPQGRLWAYTMGETILIDASATGWRRDDLIRHERCHILVGHWHM